MLFPRSGTPLRPVEVLFLVTLVGLGLYRLAPELRTGIGPPVAAPDIQLITLDGDTLVTGQLRDAIVLVNFWATWGAPCRVEIRGSRAVDRHGRIVERVVGIYREDQLRARLDELLRESADPPRQDATARWHGGATPLKAGNPGRPGWRW